MTDPGEGPGGPPPPPLFLDRTEARRAEEIFFGARAPPCLKVWMTAPLPPLSQGLDPVLPWVVLLLSHCFYSLKIYGESVENNPKWETCGSIETVKNKTARFLL